MSINIKRRILRAGKFQYRYLMKVVKIMVGNLFISWNLKSYFKTLGNKGGN
ncbi:hypothetical protein HMPREF9103_01949 [Lentilactobacillus parafarraginis F0439]|uniref:Uncharacterized protein n=1 Tax=Lentilactobacillus parafarraginis F0439 TaxID=797515 RepID=G9ZQE2_9LACO|nr:hypothetical protein HMPREF9103_01949 [Lentilactobacillus parafarraginis F0439]